MRIRAGVLAVVLCVSGLVVAAPGAHACVEPRPVRRPYQKVLTAAIAELQRYWADEYPDLYGDRYQPIPARRIIAAGPA